jgi:hypothetical protein
LQTQNSELKPQYQPKKEEEEEEEKHEEWNCITCRKINGTGDHQKKWNNPNIKRQIL